MPTKHGRDHILAPLTPGDRKEFRGIINRHRLGKFSSQLEALAQLAIRLTPAKRDTYKAVGNTRIGGEPDLPPEIDWPVTDDGYLDFLAQINLAEMPQLESDFLPARGFLWFFLGNQSYAPHIPHRVLFFDDGPSALRRVSPPEGVKAASGEKPFNAYQVTTRRIISMPGYMSGHLSYNPDLGDEFGEDDVHDTYHGRFLEALRPDFDDETRPSQLLGYPVELGGSPSEDAYQNAIENELRAIEVRLAQATAAKSSEEVKHLKKQAKDLNRRLEELEDREDGAMRLTRSSEWVLLLLLNSHLNSKNDWEMCWHDAGQLQFMIRRDDLRAQKFDATYAGIDGG